MGNYNIGVNLVEGAGLSPIEGISTSVSAIMGNFLKGPLDQAVLVTGMAYFEKIFGDKPAPGSTSYYSVKAFFAKVGQAPLYIIRVASSTAALGTLSITDGSVATIRIDALSEGAWGNAISVKTLAYSILSTTPAEDIAVSATSAVLVSVEGLEVGSDLKLYNGTQTEYVRLTAVDRASKTVTWTTGLTNAYTTENGVITSQEFQLEVYHNGVLVETHNGIGVNEDTTFFIEKVLTSSQSDYVAGYFIKETPVNTYADLPQATGPTALASGADGLDDVIGTDYSGSQSSKTGVYALDEVENLFRFCCPNPILTDAEVPTAYLALAQALLNYADTRVTLMYYADTAYDQTVAQAVTWANNFVGRRMVIFWPWGKVTEDQLTKWIPSSSLVMAIAVEKDYRRGVHKNLGNEVISYITDLKYHVSVAEGEILNDARVNTIRRFAGRGIRTYGGRTQSAETAWRFVNYSELWNYIARSLVIACQNVPFEPHDAQLWKSVTRRITDFLANEHKKGALFDASNPTGIPYSVLMDETNNPPDQVALGIANVKVEYVPVGVAEKFVIELKSTPGGLLVS